MRYYNKIPAKLGNGFILNTDKSTRKKKQKKYQENTNLEIP